LEVDYLINNAGFAVWGSIIDRPLQDNLDLVQVMVASVVTLTSLFASDMVTRGIGGKILNVGSIADILPGGPYNSCYFASKAFISSFSHAVDHELRSKGVTCTLLAPGNTDSGLLKASGLDKARVAKAPRASPEHVAEVGYQAMLDGKLHVVCDRKSTALSWLIPFLPRRRVLKIIEDFHLPS
jgi:short-subunit dehydrogenase